MLAIPSGECNKTPTTYFLQCILQNLLLPQITEARSFLSHSATKKGLVFNTRHWTDSPGPRLFHYLLTANKRESFVQ